MVEELLASDLLVKQIIYSNDEFSDISDSAVKISTKAMEQCSAMKTTPGILAVAQTLNLQPLDLGSVNLILDDIKDPGNMGTIIRSASWFGIDRLILTPDCVDIYNPKVVQSTMGGLFHLHISRASKDEILKVEKAWAGSLLIADMNGESSSRVEWPKSVALVIGSESQGVSDKFRDAAESVVTIEKIGKGESLNAAISASILMSQISSRSMKMNFCI